MKRQPMIRPWMVAALVLAGLPPVDALRAQETIERVAVVKLTERAIVFEPQLEFERLELTIAGPDLQFARSFRQRPVVEFENLTDGAPPDGTYRYELRRVPKVDPEVRERLARARQDGNEKAIAELRRRGLLPRGPFVLSGAFTLLEGRAVDGGAEEKESGRPREPVTALSGGLRVSGDLEVDGAKKFRAVDPDDGGREILFAALEGPEVGTYFRGSAELVGGEAVIELPLHFRRVTEADDVTVQLTPVGGWLRLYVAERSRDKLVVRSAGGEEDGRFDFLVQGIRRGFADFRVERDRDPR